MHRSYIRLSKSLYGTSILFVDKNNGILQMCIKYRALNKIIIKNNYPFFQLDDVFDKLARA